MLFSSPEFFLFFLAYFLLHLAIPLQFRLYLVICGSTIFYAWWKISYAWLPYLLMAIAYFGSAIAERAAPSARKYFVAATIFVLFIPLVFFKYTNFLFQDVLGTLFGLQGKVVDLTLPLGVSFVTFTLTAYVIDIYRGRYTGARRPTTVLAYVLFFPHLIAGPILRPHELIPQLDEPQRATLRNIAIPLSIFTVGLVKKLVFADQIAGLVDAAYAPGAQPSGPAALLAIYGFSAQIYCDFSGYTDMAIGLALSLGIHLPTNFLRPYAAVSLVDFWRRWHITLSFWLRDYLYIPLGGNRHGELAQIRNIIITMTLGGLWHGASWTFVIWGLLHGVALSFVHALRNLTQIALVLPRWLGVLLTFNFVTFAWTFFRAPDTETAAKILAAPFREDWTGSADFFSSHIFVVALLAVLLITHPFDDHRRVRIVAERLRNEVLWPLIVAMWIIAITVSQGSSAKFLYFDF
jgi:D-alanyl-lipoteichoic acid acyltransferase DltB (MBOAT superfamily)